MTEEKIRPSHLMRESDKIQKREIKKILAYSNKFLEVPCPACESDSFSFFFKKDGFTFVLCKKCETVFINPRPDFDILRDFYENSELLKYWNEKIFTDSEDYRRCQIFIPRAEKVIALCKIHNASNKVFVDIGAGFGTFCEEVIKLSFFDKVMAVEPSSYLAKTCRTKGINVIEKPIENVELGEASVITSFELIEHLFRPKHFLLACKNRLVKGGLFILSTPNVKGFEMSVLGKLSNGFRGPNHLNYFHPKSLCHLLEYVGFEIVEVLTPGKLDAELVRNKIQKGVLNSLSCPGLNYFLIDNWKNVGKTFQRFISDNKLSSHLWVVVKKIDAK